MNPRNKDYQAALALRLEGKSYGEIREVFKMPKSTLSGWFSGLKLSNEAKNILRTKTKNGYLKLLEFNKVRTINIIKENESIRKEHESKIGKLSNRELMILGAALYWGEGYKNFNQKKSIYPYICFGNSDPEMVAIFVKFLKKIIGVPQNRIRAQAMIYPNLSPMKSIEYWQRITGIPKENFRYHVAVSRASQGKRPFNILPYGTLQIRITRRQDFFKVRGMMDGIIKSI